MNLNFSNWFKIQESLALSGNYKGSIFQRLVAAEYKLSPDMTPEAIPAYKDLFTKPKFQFKQIFCSIQ